MFPLGTAGSVGLPSTNVIECPSCFEASRLNGHPRLLRPELYTSSHLMGPRFLCAGASLLPSVSDTLRLD